mgnify:FL=1
MSKKRTILFSNNGTGRSVFVVMKDDKVFELDTDTAPEEDRVEIMTLMTVNHYILRQAEGPDKFNKCVKDMEKIVTG